MTVSVNSPLFANSSTLILSKDQPTSFVGIEENPFSELLLFPNPAQNGFEVKGISNGTPYRITNQLGQTQSEGVYLNSIDVTNLPEGVYFIDFQGKRLNFTK
jgi:hypothetical protein